MPEVNKETYAKELLALMVFFIITFVPSAFANFFGHIQLNLFPWPVIFAIIGAGFLALSRMGTRWWNYIYGTLGMFLFIPLVVAMGIPNDLENFVPKTVAAAVVGIFALLDCIDFDGTKEFKPVLWAMSLTPILLIASYWP